MNFTHPYYPRDRTHFKGGTPPVPIPIPPVTQSNADAAIAAKQLKERRKNTYGIQDTLLAGSNNNQAMEKSLLG